MAEMRRQEQEEGAMEGQHNPTTEGQGRGMGYDKPESPMEAAPFIASVVEAMEGVEFPATKEDVLQCAGDQEVQYKDQRISIRKAIERSDMDKFSSVANVVQAIRDRIEEGAIPER